MYQQKMPTRETSRNTTWKFDPIHSYIEKEIFHAIKARLNVMLGNYLQSSSGERTYGLEQQGWGNRRA